MTTITLPAIMDRNAVTMMRGALGEALGKGAAVEVACEGVEQIGQSGLQLLLAAIRTAQQRGIDLGFSGADGALGTTAKLAGLDGVLFGARG